MPIVMCRKKGKLIVKIILLCLILVFNVPIPVRKEISAIEIKLDDATYLEDSQITISGYYNINLFKQDTFYGQVSVPNFIWTNEKMKSPLLLDREHGSLMEYYKPILSPTSQYQGQFEYTFGRLLVEFYMAKPVIMVYSDGVTDKSASAEKETDRLLGGGSWSMSDGYCIVAGANNREDAIALLVGYGIT